MKYSVVSLNERFELFDKQDEISTEVWPEFMLHDPIANKYWMPFIEAFKEYQLLIMEEDEILAIINAVPIHYDGELKDLPENGWDWATKKSILDFREDKTPNILVGLQIVINKKYQGKGLSSIAVKEMANLAKKYGFDKLIIPVRPSDKHNYPLIDMKDYIKWNNSIGLPADNWLRVHIKAGGEIIKVCNKAMYIPGKISEWEEWTGLKFPGNGSYIVQGALNPIIIDVEKDLGVYIEPNVWILHKTV